MPKIRTIWYCNECGTKQAKWTGQCAACKNWNTFVEEVEAPTVRKFASQKTETNRPVRLSEVESQDTKRHQTLMPEFDRLLGGGLVTGSLSLVGGEPGIGKSTLLLQLSNQLAKQGLLVLYVCGEESVEQTAARAKRLGLDSQHLLFLSETCFTSIKTQIDALSPDVVIVDSIQIVYKTELSSAPGSVSQVRETATEFMHIAKGQGITILLVGHVTKSGEIAGPRVLEHLVDTVLYFEGDRQQNFRVMRVVKNRFGATDEIAVFAMTSKGLTEIPNPSELFLEERRGLVAGSVIVPTMEGSRPFLVEIQALVTKTAFPTPSRKSTGLDSNRLSLLLAVIEKRLKYRLYNCDVFVSIAGGLKLAETAGDLGVLLAIASSFCNVHLDPKTIVMGEVGLGGEIRGIPRIDARLKEATRMGFERAIIPKRCAKGLLESPIKTVPVDLVEEAIDVCLN